mgnify:CR=1 FL=1
MDRWLNSSMSKCIILIIITKIVWAQTNFDSEENISKDIPANFDKLILKNGIEYIGEYSKTDFKLYSYNPDDTAKEIIYFKPLDTFAFQPVAVHMIKVLQLKDGTLLYNNERKITYTEKKLLWTFVITLAGIYCYSRYSDFSSGMFDDPIWLP